MKHLAFVDHALVMATAKAIKKDTNLRAFVGELTAEESAYLDRTKKIHDFETVDHTFAGKTANDIVNSLIGEVAKAMRLPVKLLTPDLSKHDSLDYSEYFWNSVNPAHMQLQNCRCTAVRLEDDKSLRAEITMQQQAEQFQHIWEVRTPALLGYAAMRHFLNTLERVETGTAALTTCILWQEQLDKQASLKFSQWQTGKPTLDRPEHRPRNISVGYMFPDDSRSLGSEQPWEFAKVDRDHEHAVMDQLTGHVRYVNQFCPSCRGSGSVRNDQAMSGFSPCPCSHP